MKRFKESQMLNEPRLIYPYQYNNENNPHIHILLYATIMHNVSQRQIIEKLTFFFFWSFILFFNFTILYWFCHISTWIHPRYTRVPHPEPSSLLPPCTIPLGHPSAPAPSIQYRASHLDWLLVSKIKYDQSGWGNFSIWEQKDICHS